MTTKTNFTNALQLTFGYAGRGIMLAAFALCLAVGGCDDDPAELVTDAAVDASGDTKAADTSATPDTSKDSSADSKPGDAGKDALTDAL